MGEAMIIRRSEMNARTIESCHGGKGALECIELFNEPGRTAPGLKFAHDDIVPPGATIGEHTHEEDEEMYLILEGVGEMTCDRRTFPVGPGDLCLTRLGGSHSLRNTGRTPMRIIVVGVNA